jgi:hypothetical protein
MRQLLPWWPAVHTTLPEIVYFTNNNCSDMNHSHPMLPTTPLPSLPTSCSCSTCGPWAVATGNNGGLWRSWCTCNR